MFELGAILFFAVASYVLWLIRKAKARSKIREIDAGKRCVACDGTSIETFGGNVRCLRCGHVASLAGLQAAMISESELSSITRPERR